MLLRSNRKCLLKARECRITEKEEETKGGETAGWCSKDSTQHNFNFVQLSTNGEVRKWIKLLEAMRYIPTSLTQHLLCKPHTRHVYGIRSMLISLTALWNTQSSCIQFALQLHRTKMKTTFTAASTRQIQPLMYSWTIVQPCEYMWQ